MSLTVTNTGAVAGRHTALLFVIQEYRSFGVAPEVHRLVGFANLELAPGESGELHFAVSTELLSYTGEDMRPLVESGPYTLRAEYGASKVEAQVHVTAAGLSASWLPPLPLGRARLAVNPMLPWMAAALSSAVLMACCFACGIAATLYGLRNHRLRIADAKNPYKHPGETELSEAERAVADFAEARTGTDGSPAEHHASDGDTSKGEEVDGQENDLRTSNNRAFT